MQATARYYNQSRRECRKSWANEGASMGASPLDRRAQHAAIDAAGGPVGGAGQRRTEIGHSVGDFIHRRESLQQ